MGADRNPRHRLINRVVTIKTGSKKHATNCIKKVFTFTGKTPIKMYIENEGFKNTLLYHNFWLFIWDRFSLPFSVDDVFRTDFPK